MRLDIREGTQAGSSSSSASGIGSSSSIATKASSPSSNHAGKSAGTAAGPGRSKRLAVFGGTDFTGAASRAPAAGSVLLETATASPRPQSESQPRDEGDLQKRDPERRCSGLTLQGFLRRASGQGMKPEPARVTLARKVAAIALLLWKERECFDAGYLRRQAA